MRKKRNDFDAVGAERMTDTELSKKLGSYQRMESIGILLGVILVITGCIMMFVYRNIIVICILAFSGVALFLLVAQPAQKKKKALIENEMQQQLNKLLVSYKGHVAKVELSDSIEQFNIKLYHTAGNEISLNQLNAASKQIFIQVLLKVLRNLGDSLRTR